jgi:hypothetical protein
MLLKNQVLAREKKDFLESGVRLPPAGRKTLPAAHFRVSEEVILY